ncbi:DNA ligase (ATP) [Rhodotorula kratochvilovae]
MPKGGGWAHHRKRDEADDDDDPGELAQAPPDELVKPAGIENGPTPPFGTLCGLFEQFESITRNKHKKNEKKGEVLARFFERWRSDVGPDLYPIVRLMLPERDNRRRTYNLKEQKLAKALISALDIPPNNSTALKLINWKVPTAQDPGAGEFAAVAQEVIKSRSMVVRRVSDTSIDVVNEILDELSHTRGAAIDVQGHKRSLQAEHARILKRCVQKMTPSEMKWLIRIILRDLKIGMGEKTIFDRLHPDANHLFNTCSDIMRVCWTLHDPHHRLPNEDFTVKPMRVFRPMLSWRSQRNLADVVKMMRRGRGPRDMAQRALKPGEYAPDEFIIEEKLDGERIQMHKVGSKYGYWSRNNKEYTYLYGHDASNGSLTPYIQDCLPPEVEEIILDGEMLVWDPNIGKYMAFGNLKTFAITRHFGESDPRPCFKVFDILYLKGKGGEGQALLDKSLWQRKKLLGQLIKHKQGVMEIADCAKGSTAEDIREYLERIVEERGEGLVVKHPLSFYNLGAREESWIKIKPDYMDELGEKIDGLVVGGYWGQGGRSGYLASYLIGLRDEVDGKLVVRSFAKVGSGLNRADYARIIEKTRDKWKDVDRRKPETVPSWFKTVNEWPDVLIEPSASFVIEIKAAEIVGGVDYGAGMTLRFPRAIKIREDKDPVEDSMDFQTVQLFRSGPKKRSIGDEFSSKNKAARFSKSTKATSVSAAVDNVEVRSDIFAGVTFFIFSTKPASLKDELQKKVVEHGGAFIQKIPDEDKDRIVVASDYTGIKSRKGGKTVDVYDPKWILDSIAQGRRLPPRKKYLVHATDETAASAAYAGSDDDGDAAMRSDEDAKPALSPSPSAAGERKPYSQMYRDLGEAALDSEDSPETQSDDDAYRIAQIRRMKISDSADEHEEEPEFGGFEAHFPRKGAMPAPVNEVNRDVARLGFESTDGSQGTEDLFGSAQVDKLKLDPDALTDAPVGLGAGAGDDAQMAFDPAFLFRPLVAYFDTAENAAQNGLQASGKPERIQARADSELNKARDAFTREHGTATSSLADPALTHIVVSKLVPERYGALVARTAQPRYRRLVTSEWVHSCVEEEDLMDEEDYKP